MNRLVALALPGGPEFVAELQRVFDDGDAALPVDLRLAGPARERLLAAMAPAVIVEAPRHRRLCDGAIPIEPGDALVMATSGTTGTPKGVVLTHDAIGASARATSARLGVDKEHDRWWACLPFSHIGGLSVVLRSIAEGVECEAEAGFSVEGAAAALERGATLTSLVPTALRRLGEQMAGRFRRIVLGGQAPPERLAENVVTTYGLTETGSGVVYDGVPLEGVEVRLEPDTSEISLRGPMLLRAYRQGSDPKSPEGWFRTGDAGRIAEDGRLVVDGRLGDLIISGGENVWPAPLEAILERHPAVVDVAVAGRPDPEWGERVTAFVVVNEPVDAAALLAEARELVRAELAGFAAPREVVIVGELPRTGIGKIRREALVTLEGPSVSI